MGNPKSLQPAHFGGTSLQQMHNWVQSGSGASSMHSASDQWQKEQQYMQDLATRVRDRMTQVHAYMESQSGAAVQNAVAPVTMWAEATADNTYVQAQQMQAQGNAFSKLQAAVPNPSELQNVPSDNWFQKTWASITGSKTDTQIAQQHNEQLRQEAVTAFNSYQSTTQSAVSGTPTFTAPPPIATDTAVQSNGGGPGVGGFASPGGGGGTAGGGGGSAGALHGGGVGGSTPVVDHSATGGVAPVGTHSESYTPVTPTPSFQSSSLGSAAGGGLSGGLSGVLGVGALGAAAGGLGGGGLGGAGGSTGGRLGGTSAGGGADEEAGGRAGNAGRAGSLAEEEAAGRGGAGNSTSTGQTGAAGRGAGRKGEEDDEHYSPEFLKDDHGFFDDEMPRVAPPVFGE